MQKGERGEGGRVFILVLEIAVIVLLIVANGFFALAELAIVSSRKTRLQHLADEGHSGAKIALQLADDPSIFLASVQIGITLVGILAGAFGGAALAERFSAVLLPLLGRFAYPVSFVLIVAAITYFTVIVGELAPKRIALTDPERWAVRVARPMRVVSAIAAPLVRFLGASSSLALRLVRVPATVQRPPVSDEEVKMLFEEGIAAGVFERAEKEIVSRLLRLSDRRVNSVMTQRPDIVWLDLRATREEIADAVSTHSFTAYPVCEDDLDQLKGIVFTRELIGRLLAGETIALGEMLHAPLVLPEWAYALKSIDQLRESGVPLAIIINEYGSTEGLLTMTDLVSALVGEIPTSEEPDIVRRDERSLLVDGLLSTDDLKAELDLATLPNEEQARYQTLGGFLMYMLGRIARTGDAIECSGYRFEVVDMDDNRIDRVLITRLTPPTSK